jgi:hypothetical protein
MPEPLTLVVGGFLAGFLGDVVTNVTASKAEKLLDAFLDRRGNQDIQKALHQAWRNTITDLFKQYRSYAAIDPQNDYTRSLVRARKKRLLNEETIQQIFPTLDDPRTYTNDQDVARLFTGDRETVRKQLITHMEELELLQDLPPALRGTLTQNILHGLTFHFVEIAVKRDPKARDALFFQQLIGVRQTTERTAADIDAIWQAVMLQFEQTESYQHWHREVLSREKLTQRVISERGGLSAREIGVALGERGFSELAFQIVQYVATKRGELPRDDNREDETIAKIAEAVAQGGSGSVAQQIAELPRYGHAKRMAYCNVSIALAQRGDINQANAAVRKIAYDPDDAVYAWIAIVEALAIQGDDQGVKDLLQDRIHTQKMQEHAQRRIARVYGRQSRFTLAFNCIPENAPDELIDQLAVWGSAMEEQKDGLFLRTLNATASILTWFHPGYDLYCVMSNNPDSDA